MKDKIAEEGWIIYDSKSKYAYAVNRLLNTPPHPQQEELERIHIEEVNNRGRKKKEPKADKYNKGDTCPKCGKGTLYKKPRSNKRIKPNQPFMFLFTYQCNSCKKTFHVESAKVMIDQPKLL